MMRGLLMAFIVVVGGCGPPPPEIVATGAVRLAPPTCDQSDPVPFEGVGLLDVATADNAFYFVGVHIEKPDESRYSTMVSTADVSLSFNGRTVVEAERSSNGRVIGNAQLPLPPAGVSYVFLIEPADVAAMTADAEIADALSIDGARVRIDAQVSLGGIVVEFRQADVFLFDTDRFRSNTSPRFDVETNAITIPIDLCRNCLLPTCPDGERPTGACFYGQDFPSGCVPE
jgi:hypothetical protein